FQSFAPFTEKTLSKRGLTKGTLQSHCSTTAEIESMLRKTQALSITILNTDCFDKKSLYFHDPRNFDQTKLQNIIIQLHVFNLFYKRFSLKFSHISAFTRLILHIYDQNIPQTPSLGVIGGEKGRKSIDKRGKCLSGRFADQNRNTFFHKLFCFFHLFLHLIVATANQTSYAATTDAECAYSKSPNLPPDLYPDSAIHTKPREPPVGKERRRPGHRDRLVIHCISAFVKLAQSEYALLTEIIPEHHQKKTFDSLIQEALDNLMLEGENIVSAARRAILRHDYSAVLSIFPILRHLKMNKSDFDQTLQGTAASTKNKLPALITSMETIGARALEEFADSIKNDPDKEYNMPKDGTVHELTSNAILFLQQLLDFHETAGAMLASQVLGDTYNIPLDPRESSSSSSYTSDFNKRLLSSYICKVLGNLQLNLLSKSKVYEDQALSAIFLHNNYNYILKSLEK
ncbi:hypothetical protein WMY93_034282, partial [Mugilogobius chulae]